MLRQIYTTTIAEQAHHLLRNLDVSLIVVGDLERKAYPGDGFAKFAAAPELIFCHSGPPVIRPVLTTSA